jgi:hypothetical protein
MRNTEKDQQSSSSNDELNNLLFQYHEREAERWGQEVKRLEEEYREQTGRTDFEDPQDLVDARRKYFEHAGSACLFQIYSKPMHDLYKLFNSIFEMGHYEMSEMFKVVQSPMTARITFKKNTSYLIRFRNGIVGIRTDKEKPQIAFIKALKNDESSEFHSYAKRNNCEIEDFSNYDSDIDFTAIGINGNSDINCPVPPCYTIEQIRKILHDHSISKSDYDHTNQINPNNRLKRDGIKNHMTASERRRKNDAEDKIRFTNRDDKIWDK